MPLRLGDGELAEVEDARGEHGIGLALHHGIDHVLGVAAAAARDHRHLHRLADRARQRDVVSVLVPVGVHAGQQDLAGAQLDGPLRPRHRVEPGGLAPAVRVDLPRALAGRLRIDGDDDALRAKALRAHADEIRIGYGSAVERHLVGAQLEQHAHVEVAADAAADGERDEDLVGGACDHVVGRRAVVAGRRYVEKHQLVRPLRVVQLRQLHRVAGVAQLDERDALHDASVIDVETRDDPLGQHGGS